MYTFEFSSKLQITWSGFKISISGFGLIIFAVISPGPFASRISFFGPFVFNFKDKDLIFKTMSVTSSLTPLIDENSCNTPSICIAVTAVPWIEERRTLLNALPKVKAKPRSKGSTTIFANFLSSLAWISILEGLINSFQFLSINVSSCFYLLLNSSFFRWSTTVVSNWTCVFNRQNFKTPCLQCS